MADSNAPEHTDRGLFGLFGKKEEKADEHVQQHLHTADPPATHTPSYAGQEAGGNGYDGEVHHALPSALAHQIEHHAEEKKADEHVQHQPHSVDPHATHAPSCTADVHHAPPPAVSHHTQQFGQEEGENKQHQGLMGKLHRSNSSSSSSSSDEEEGGDKKEGRKKKDKVKGKRADHSGDKQEEHEKKGLMEKIKEKLPGHHKEEEKAH